MARIYGSYRILGSVGRLRHYKLNNSDEIFVAEKGGANINLIMNHPHFVRTRELMAEMTPRSNMAKIVKRKLGQWSATIVNRYMIGSINAALRIAQKRDLEGIPGCKSIYLSRCKDVLNIPIYYWYKPLRDIMKCPYTVETSEDRKSVTVYLANFIPKEQIMPSKEASHFQFSLSVGVVCDIVYNYEKKSYEWVHGADLNCSLKEFESEWIPVNAGAMGDVTLTVSLPDELAMEDDMTVLRAFGIVFGKMTYKVDALKKETGSIEFLGAV